MDYATTVRMSGRSIYRSSHRSQDGACSEKGKDFQVVILDYHEKEGQKERERRKMIIKEITK